jgi:polyribonucleotide nucleotidyltransferase
MMTQATIHEIEFAPGKSLRLETGRLAKQANGAVVVRQGDTMVLCTAVLADEPREGQSFFPLTVEYREKFAAGGRIPGGFIKREGRPTDKEILSSRLIDRAIRPLFPDGFFHEVQIICYVISADDRYDADVLAGTGASAALLLAGAPFDGPIAEVRVGRVDGQFVVNPTLKELEQSDINLVVAGKEDAIVMVEGEMKEVSEEDMLEALEVAHEAIRKLCRGQLEFVAAHGRPEPFPYQTTTLPEELVARVRELAVPKLEAHLRAPYDKQTFYEGLEQIGEETVAALLGTTDAEGNQVLAEATPEGWTADQIRKAVSQVTREVMRQMILREGRRIDGRSLDEIRPIWMEVGYLPRVHGSAIFTRGETQVLASVTLGTSKDVQMIDQIFVQGDKRFFLHYEFPPFCTGEIRFLRGPGRREIGHGYLAERALAAMLPDESSFPYTIRVNADVLESNGSSSMASVCAGSLALMDAGVPVKKHVAGVAMGLIKEGDQVAILTDILGTEDHLGDMDFKVAGTRDGITACQMDIKIGGLTREIMQRALEQARRARMYILDLMEQTIEAPRPELSPYAPRLTQITIDPEFIGAVIGPGGRVVQGIQRETNTTIEIEERDGVGVVTVAATNQENAQRAIEMIKQIVAVPEVGAEYEGIVRSIQSFGAIVEIMPGKEGLLHISELDHGYVRDIHDYLKVGDKVRVKLIEIREDGKLRLSRKAFLPPPEPEAKNGEPAREQASAERSGPPRDHASGRSHGPGHGRGGRSGRGRGPDRGRGGRRR